MPSGLFEQNPNSSRPTAILLVNSSFGRGYTAIADLLTDWACDMRAVGFAVDVLCIVNQDVSQPPADVPVKEMPHRLRLVSWTVMKAFFLAYASLYLVVNARRYDLVVSPEDPAGIAALLNTLRRIGVWRGRLVCWLMDLASHQDDLVSGLGGVRRLRRRLRFWIEGAYRSADAVVTLGSCMAARLTERAVLQSRICVIGAWTLVDSMMSSQPTDIQMFSDRNLQVLYSGHLGEWADVDLLVGLIRRARGQRISFTFAGNGQGMDQLRSMAAEELWDHTRFIGRVPGPEVPQLLTSADVHLACLDARFLGTCVPSKTYAAMAVGRPILFLGPSACQAALDISASQGGFVSDGDASGAIQFLLDLRDYRSLAQAKGGQGRHWYEANRSRSVAAQQWQALLDSIAPEAR